MYRFINKSGNKKVIRDYYPIFIRVAEADREIFEYYRMKLNLKISQKKGIYYDVEFMKDFNVAHHGNIPVDSLDDAIHFMRENQYNFEPALEMVQNIYKKKLGVKYQEAVANV